MSLVLVDICLKRGKINHDIFLTEYQWNYPSAFGYRMYLQSLSSVCSCVPSIQGKIATILLSPKYVLALGGKFSMPCHLILTKPCKVGVIISTSEKETNAQKGYFLYLTQLTI